MVDLIIERCDCKQQLEEEQDVVAMEDDEYLLSSTGPDALYEKIFPNFDHDKKGSMELIYILGTRLALDEQMIRFTDRSNRTHHMKNKPIKQGLKCLVLATIQGSVVNFSPDGCTIAKSDRMDYNINNIEFGKVGSMVMYVVDSITKSLDKQTRIVRAHAMIRKTRAQKNEKKMKKDLIQKKI